MTDEFPLLQHDQGRLTLQVHLTSACNLRCRHCYVEGGYPSVFLDAHGFDQVLSKALDYSAFLGADPGLAILTGGEPTLSPILLDSIRKLRDAGFRQVLLLTNGTLLSESLAGAIHRAGCETAQICIEGDERTHDEIRCGSWKKVRAAWETCQQVGITVFNQSTVHALNFNQIDTIIDICRDADLEFCCFIRQVPNGALRPLTSAEWFSVLEKLYFQYHLRDPWYREFVQVRDLLWSTLFFRSRSHPYICTYDYDFPETVIVETNGDLYRCRRSGIPLGNVFETDLKVLYQSDRMGARAREVGQTLTPCARCPKNVRGVCGVCPAMARSPSEGVQDMQLPCAVGDELSEEPVGSPASAEYGHVSLQGIPLSVSRFVRHLRFTGSPGPTLTEFLHREGALTEAKARGLTVSLEDLQAAANGFRAAWGLLTAADTHGWLESRHAGVADLEDFVEEILLIDQVLAPAKGTRTSAFPVT